MDQNDLESLPDSIVQCKNLQQIDVSENKLRQLPNEIGELSQLADLTVSQNCLDSLPNSIGVNELLAKIFLIHEFVIERHKRKIIVLAGRLKKLSILKADRNALTQLTPAIGTCSGLTELYLTENFLSVCFTTL